MTETKLKTKANSNKLLDPHVEYVTRNIFTGLATFWFGELCASRNRWRNSHFCVDCRFLVFTLFAEDDTTPVAVFDGVLVGPFDGDCVDGNILRCQRSH